MRRVTLQMVVSREVRLPAARRGYSPGHARPIAGIRKPGPSITPSRRSYLVGLGAGAAVGEIVEVTDHGQVTAILVPPTLTPYAVLIRAGRVRLPSGSPADPLMVDRSKSRLTSAEIIAETRGGR